MGVNVAKFEQEFARYHDMQHGIMVNSGSSANLVAVAALFHKEDNPLRRGDEVAVPAISWATTYYPLHQHGLRLRIVDVDVETINTELNEIGGHLCGPDTRAIVAVSILGNPTWLGRLEHVAQHRDIYLVEDNCESLDAITLEDRRTGTHGLLNTFSFFFSHHMATMEGGMILTNSAEMNSLCRTLRNHGWDRDENSTFVDTDGFTRAERYNFNLPGYNVRPLELTGAIGLEQLKKLPDMTSRRRNNWKLFQHLFEKDERFIIQKEYGKSSAFAFTMICRKERHRPIVLTKLRQAGIGFRMITGGNILRHPVVTQFNHTVPGGTCPNADIVHSNGFFVGNHPYDLEKQLYKLKEVLA